MHVPASRNLHQHRRWIKKRVAAQSVTRERSVTFAANKPSTLAQIAGLILE
jgi:hypothetical protein